MENTSEISIEMGNDSFLLRYAPRTERTIYDICDLNGRVIKTGVISESETCIDASDLFRKKYIVLIVDGDQMFSKPLIIAA
jgi:hypothetical protein